MSKLWADEAIHRAAATLEGTAVPAEQAEQVARLVLTAVEPEVEEVINRCDSLARQRIGLAQAMEASKRQLMAAGAEALAAQFHLLAAQRPELTDQQLAAVDQILDGSGVSIPDVTAHLFRQAAAAAESFAATLVTPPSLPEFPAPPDSGDDR